MEKVASVGGQAGPDKTNNDTHLWTRFNKRQLLSTPLSHLQVCCRLCPPSSSLPLPPLAPPQQPPPQPSASPSSSSPSWVPPRLRRLRKARRGTKGGGAEALARAGIGTLRKGRVASKVPAKRQHSASTAPAQRSKAPAGHQRAALLAGARGAPGAWSARPPARRAPAAAALSFFSFFFFLGASSPSPAASPRVAITSCGSGWCRAAHIAITPVRLAGYTQGSTASSSGHDAVRNDEWRSGLFMLGGEHAGWGGGGVCAVAKREKRQRQRQRQRARVGGPGC